MWRAAAIAVKIETRSKCVDVDDAQMIGALEGLVKLANTKRETAAIFPIKGQRRSQRNQLYPGFNKQERPEGSDADKQH